MYLPFTCYRLATLNPPVLCLYHPLIGTPHIYHISCSYIITRLVIDSVPVKHTASITDDDYYSGNPGMWQRVFLVEGTLYPLNIEVIALIHVMLAEL